MSWNGTSGNLSCAGDLLIRNNSVSGVTSIAGNTIGTIADFTQSGQVRVPGQLVVGAGASFAGVSTFTGTTQTQQLSVSGVSTFTNHINLNSGNLNIDAMSKDCAKSLMQLVFRLVHHVIIGRNQIRVEPFIFWTRFINWQIIES